MRTLISLFSAAAGLLLIASCSNNSSPGGRPPLISLQQVKTPVKERSVRQLAKETNIRQDLVAAGHYSRYARKPMNPRYITIHSTQNRNADAWQHGVALKNGRIRQRGTYLSWHFSVDQYVSLQHIPLTEQAVHAGNAAGNAYSLGIEMCEHRGNNMVKTFDRTAKLTAILMKQNNIPLRNVVPHYYWTRKNCPVPLLDNKRPGYKWSWFMSRVDYYYRCINSGISFLDI